MVEDTFVMHFIYVDDSKDHKLACFSALILPATSWRQTLDAVIAIRKQLRASDGIYMNVEYHGTEWNGGKGRIAAHRVSKARRATLFDYFLDQLARIPDLKLVNAAVPYGEDERAFEYLMNRIQRNMSGQDSRCIIISDNGKNYDKLLRKMLVFNFIPSMLGQWSPGVAAKNIVADRILEDIVYRDSKRSHLIQAADFLRLRFIAPRKPDPIKDCAWAG